MFLSGAAILYCCRAVPRPLPGPENPLPSTGLRPPVHIISETLRSCKVLLRKFKCMDVQAASCPPPQRAGRLRGSQELRCVPTGLW